MKREYVVLSLLFLICGCSSVDNQGATTVGSTTSTSTATSTSTSSLSNSSTSTSTSSPTSQASSSSSTTCLASTTTSTIDANLQKLANALTVNAKVNSQQNSASSSPPVALGLKDFQVKAAGSPSYDAEGWLCSVDTFSTGVETGEGTTYAMVWRYRMLNLSGEVVTDTLMWPTVDRLEWFSLTTSESLSCRSYRVTSGMVNYRNTIMSMPTSGSVEMPIVGTEETTFSGGFVFRMTSYEAAARMEFQPGVGTSYYHGTVLWETGDGLYSGTINIRNELNSTLLIYTGTVESNGLAVGTISYESSSYKVSITDNNGNVIEPQ